MALSSTPVREALKALEAEGLVSIAPRSGVYVRRISVNEVAEIYAIKEVLEPLMVKWAILRSTEEQLQAMVDYAREITAHADRDQLDEYVRVVEERHQMLLAVAASDSLISIFQGIDGRVRLMRYRNLSQPERMRRSAAEHQALAQAMADRDVDLACELTAASVRSAAQSLLRVISREEAGVTGPSAWSLVKELTAPGEADGEVALAFDASRGRRTSARPRPPRLFPSDSGQKG
jgi:DNA-binding GntR family transcriptional regulator